MENLSLSKKVKGEDGYKIFSIRIPRETVDQLDQLSGLTGRSRNALITTMLQYALEHTEIARSPSETDCQR